MSLKAHFELMAAYNQWMNTKVYDASARLDPAELHIDKGAFFGSVFATLNHLMVADTIWLKRFATHPAGFSALEPMLAVPHPHSLKQPLHADFEALRNARRDMDALIIAFAAEATDDAYAHSLTYASMAGQQFTEPFAALVQHCFNHQTHHRGQITTLLTQAGIDVGVTDLVALVRERLA
jgi:uncharacterized damage-inducible protein DinB